MTVTIGSLFSGYGGLDMAVERVTGGRVIFHAEIEDGPSRVLEHRYPDVSNLGDVTLIDWGTVPRVDVLCLGFPCQDVSTSGLRRGMLPGTRSGLWSEGVRAIAALRPSLVIIENVPGLRSAKAGDPRETPSEMEPDPFDMGDDRSRPVLRALGAVLGDLADLGYDAGWGSVRASDVGAPHRRERVFIVATSPDARRGGGGGWAAGSEPSGRDYAALGSGEGGAGAGRASTDAARVGHEGAERRLGDKTGRTGSRDEDLAPPADAGRLRGGSGRSSEPGEEAGGGTRGLSRGRGVLRSSADADGGARVRGTDEQGRGPAGRGTPLGNRDQAPADADRDGLGAIGGIQPAEPDTHRRDGQGSSTPNTVGDELARERGEREGGATTTGDSSAPADADDLGRGQDDADVRSGEPDARGGAPADTVSVPRERRGERDLVGSAPREAPGAGDQRERDGGTPLDSGPTPVEWGEYEPAIRRWEHVLGRYAPAPTVTDWETFHIRRAQTLAKRRRNRKPVGMRGSLRRATELPKPKLSPLFVEWMMGLPEGWVTDPALNLTRNEQLKMLGNGVVPQQAGAAIFYLLHRLGLALSA